VARLWPYAEVKRGLSIREDFPSADRLSNDWALVGSPGVDDGLILDGTNYAQRNLVGREFGNSCVTFVFEFYPERDFNGPREYFFGASGGASTYIRREPTGILLGRINGTFTVNTSSIEGVWKVGGRNTLVIMAGAGGDTKVRLNSVDMPNSPAVFTLPEFNAVSIGALFGGGDGFSGTIKQFKLFRGDDCLTEQEAIDYHNNETYWHEPPLTLDVSGDGNHGTLDGVVKQVTRGYNGDGVGQFVNLGNSSDFELQEFCILLALKKLESGELSGVISKGEDFGSATSTEYYFGVQGNGRPTLTISNGVDLEILAAGDIRAGEFATFALYVGASELRIYKNGDLASTKTRTIGDINYGASRDLRLFGTTFIGKQELYQFVKRPGTLTPTQVYDAHYQMRTQARMI
jgi:hypothetical protein